jgi:hypothetical protein
MSDSETSSDVKVKYQNSHGENLLEDKNNKPLTTDTDYYFNMIANPNKIITKSKSSTETSELNDLLKDTDKSSNSSNSSSSSSPKRSTEKSDSSRKSSTSSKKSHKNETTDSKPRYEAISVSPKQTSTHKQTSNELKPVEVKQLTPQEIRMKKIEMLKKLSEIKSKGYQLSKDYDFNSSLDEMEYEYELLKSFADKRNGVKLFKNGLLQAVSVIEFLNDKYDPFDFQLSGWGEHTSVEVDSWEDVLEEIYDKYKGTGKGMPCEIKLLYLLIASASAFHFSRSQGSKMPGLDSVLAANPGLLSKIINPGKGESSQFMTTQELNIARQKENFKKNDLDMKQARDVIVKLTNQVQMQGDTINRQQAIIDSTHHEPIASNARHTLPRTIPANQLKPNVPDIRAPDQVKDILNRIHELKPSSIKPSNTETQEDTSSNNDRLVEETTVSETNPRKKQAGRKPKKANISIF